MLLSLQYILQILLKMVQMLPIEWTLIQNKYHYNFEQTLKQQYKKLTNVSKYIIKMSKNDSKEKAWIILITEGVNG